LTSDPSAEDGQGDNDAGNDGDDGAADHQRQAMAREMPELTPFGFDLARDGDADERDEDQRAGGGNATSAQISRLTWL
jgi:hypothetical protein